MATSFMIPLSLGSFSCLSSPFLFRCFLEITSHVQHSDVCPRMCIWGNLHQDQRLPLREKRPKSVPWGTHEVLHALPPAILPLVHSTPTMVLPGSSWNIRSMPSMQGLLFLLPLLIYLWPLAPSFQVEQKFREGPDWCG